MRLLKKDIIPVILLCIFTCGIYSLYFIYTTQESIRETYRKEMLPSGFMVIILSIITCGIYGIYWMYKTCVIVNDIAMDYGIKYSEMDTILFVLLGALFTQIIYYALIQNRINEIIRISHEQGY